MSMEGAARAIRNATDAPALRSPADPAASVLVWDSFVRAFHWPLMAGSSPPSSARFSVVGGIGKIWSYSC